MTADEGHLRHLPAALIVSRKIKQTIVFLLLCGEACVFYAPPRQVNGQPRNST